MDKKLVFWILLGVVLLVGLWAFINFSAVPAAGKYDTFATCLKQAGATFYGAFWCPHCQAQKALFGDSVKLLPYVECSTPDGQNQTQVCIDKNIQSYPTWEFKDGSRFSGETPLDQLAEKTGCKLPQ